MAVATWVFALTVFALTTMSSAVRVPPLLFGSGSRGCSPAQACQTAVKEALQMGWQGIDEAWEYGTSELVARGIKESGIDRSQLFIATKIPGPVGYNETFAYFQQDLSNLSTTYVDLLLMHYPCGESWPQPRDGCSAAQDQEARLDTWRAMEHLVEQGTARAIGVSNFRLPHIQQLIAAADVKVAANQVEWHLGWHDDKLLAFCKEHEITLQAYSPLGGGGTSTGRNGDISLDDPLVTAIAQRHNVSGAQVALRWSLEQGVAVVTSTVRTDFLSEDLAVLNFTLSAEEVANLSALHSVIPAVRLVDDWPDVMMPVVAMKVAANTSTKKSVVEAEAEAEVEADADADIDADAELITVTDLMMEWGKAGGRHFDVGHGEEAEVERGVAGLLKARIASRKELFLTARLPGALGYNSTKNWINSTLGAGAHVKYLDLLLLPLPPDALSSAQACAVVRDTWKAMVEFRESGSVRSLGLLNFGVKELEWIVGTGLDSIHSLPSVRVRDDPPANLSAPNLNRVQWQPGKTGHDEQLRIACTKHNITLQATSTLATSTIPLLSQIAAAHSVSVEQVAFKWSLQLGVPVVVALQGTGGDAVSFLAGLFNFSLTNGEMSELSLSADNVETSSIIKL